MAYANMNWSGMENLFKKQKLELLKLQHDLWEIARPVGSLHSFWDLIFDIDALLKGEEGIITDANKLIKLAKTALQEHHEKPIKK